MAEQPGDETEGARRGRFFAATDYQAIPGGKKKLDFIFALVERLRAANPGLKVLDVGCGNGPLTFPIAALGVPSTGVDVNAASIERNRAANRYPNARFAVVPGTAFDLGENFDLIICSEVLEHLHEPQPLVDSIARHLAPGGTLMVTVPNGYGPREVLGRVEIFLRRKLGIGRVIDPVRRACGMLDHATKCAVHTSNPDQDHVQKFTLREMRGMFAQAGLALAAVTNSIFIFGVVFGKSPAVDRFDSRLADFLPHWAASGWYFLCQRAGTEPSP
ncbi:MAG TPA: methyltransferase domain-containing protein [Candidatus Methanoperedens sp.]|nr:methyltransferase domain-containing protein [Candidatus Methanoperedens sp.]